MSREDLIPKDFSKMPNHIELARKGGLVRSPAKLMAAKLRGLKWAKKENKPKYLQKIIDLVTDGSLSAFELMRFCEQIKDDLDLTQDQKIKLLGVMERCHRAIHGDKIMTIGFNMDFGEDIVQRAIERIEVYKKEENAKKYR